jgi:hypothetical protein
MIEFRHPFYFVYLCYPVSRTYRIERVLGIPEAAWGLRFGETSKPFPALAG